MAEARLIEAAFPLRQVSLDSVHEKNVRHGHVSTLHIWPARRPLAASRAVLLATLLSDPGSPKERMALLERIGGRVVQAPDPSGKRMREETRGGVLHWGRDDEGELARLRDEIRQAFGGRTPRVLDPFAGGGAIPLEAMRLGCEAVAGDLNPVAWYILRCTLHYPKVLAGEGRPLPACALEDREFVEAFLKAQGFTKPARLRAELARYGHGDGTEAQATTLHGWKHADHADAAWHLRAWGLRVLGAARARLAARYPTYAEFEPVRRKGRREEPPRTVCYRPRPPELLRPDADGRVSVAALNAEFDSLYLEDEANPRWVAKPAVAYLWARTVRCGNCRAEIPLLKTRWLSKTARKRVRLTMERREDGAGVAFGIEADVPAGKGDAPGAGTMSGSGATCPCCGTTATMDDLRAAGRAGRLGELLVAVVVDGQQGKEYRLPTDADIRAARVGADELDALYAEVPFGVPSEPTPSERSLGIRVTRYGFGTWRTLFTDRQLLALGTFVREIRRCSEAMHDHYPPDWREALVAYLAPAISRLADRGSALATWVNSRDTIGHTFARFALPMVWDFAESCPLADTTGGFIQAIEWIARVVEHVQPATDDAPAPSVSRQSAAEPQRGNFDVICTDPPYYDAIPYSDLMDFFHVWLRRVLHGLDADTDAAFADVLGPKWDAAAGDGELIDDASRFGGDRQASKRNYEDGMARAFARFRHALRDDGRLVIVFANKSPDAWETLVSALIRAGFVVHGSWPIRTEMQNRQRSLSSSALSSSIWLVCRKRPAASRPGWDNRVLGEMQANITQRLRDFWDAGIRGPDFVWSATGPALQAFSRHPVVRKVDQPGEPLTVADFLSHVRRMVVGFVVSQVLKGDHEASDDLDEPTTYYLLHRNDFGLGAAPAGACILYALSCNLADADLDGRLDLLVRGERARASDDDDSEAEGGRTSGGGARLKPWRQRRVRDQPRPPLIDCVHRVMQLWKDGDQGKVDQYLKQRNLARNDLFARVVQALIELADRGSDERATLESIQNHLGAAAGTPAERQMSLGNG